MSDIICRISSFFEIIFTLSFFSTSNRFLFLPVFWKKWKSRKGKRKSEIIHFAQKSKGLYSRSYKINICERNSLTERNKYAIIQKNETGYKNMEGQEVAGRAEGVYD